MFNQIEVAGGGTYNAGTQGNNIIETTPDQDNGTFSLPFTLILRNSSGPVATCLYNSSGILPVELLSFTASAGSPQTELSWTTAQESQNAYFSIYHSTDGKAFQLLAKVPGAGDSDQPQAYSYLHQSAVNGAHFYRLTQTDYDGTTTVLGTRQVFVDGKVEAPSFFPNPASTGQTISLQQLPAGTQTVLLYNAVGQQWTLRPQDGRVQLPNSLPAGLYYLQLPGEAQLRMSALIIE